MLDTYLSADEYVGPDVSDGSVIGWLAPHLNLPLAELKSLPLDEQWNLIAQRAKLADGIGAAEIRRMAEVCQAHIAAFDAYRPRPYQGPVVLLKAEDGEDLDPRWRSLCSKLCVETVPGNHYSMLRKPHTDVLAERLVRYLQQDAGRQAEARKS